MIKGIQVKTGFPKDLPAIGNKVFEFTEGMNVLFGSNGCGKSTILKCLKAYSGIEKGGWSKINNVLKLGAGSPQHFPYVYRAYTPDHCDCVVLKDSSPSFYNDGDVKIDGFAWFFTKEALSEDGMTTEVEQMGFLTDKPSSGQYRTKKINKLLNMLQNPPDLVNATPNHRDEIFEINYLKSLPNFNRITLLLDEPERALSLPRQIELFDLLKDLSKDYQIILATHSPFVLFGSGFNMIDMDNGYAEQCLQTFRECLKAKDGVIANKKQEQLQLF